MRKVKKIKKLLVFVIGLVLFSLIFAISPVNMSADEGDLVAVDWARSYYGFGGNTDWVNDITLDSSGNVYVTGQSYVNSFYDDFATVALDSEGTQLWVARYDGPENRWDRGFDIAISPAGNVVVSGTCYSPETSFDYTLISYDSLDGSVQWMRSYDGPVSGVDIPNDLAIDSEGNIYIIGQSNGDETYFDYATIKYDSEGNELWVARYDGPASSMDRGRYLAVDSVGNVYVTGWTLGSGTNYDFTTIKYNLEGEELWVREYNGPCDGGDFAEAIVVDSEGNVYVSGYSYDDETLNDFTTIAYDTDGNELWVRRYNGPGNGQDYPLAMTLGPTGNIYVTGFCVGIGTGVDFATIAYNPYGNELWTRQYNGPGNGEDKSWDVAVDISGNVYVTGGSYSSKTDFDSTTIKYDPNGNELWVKRYDGPENNHDETHYLTLDLYGNIFVGGFTTYSATGMDYLIIKYSQGPSNAIDNLIYNVRSMDLHHGTENGLVKKLMNAKQSLGKNLHYTTINQMNAFINEVEAQKGKKITVEQADELIEMSQYINEAINEDIIEYK